MSAPTTQMVSPTLYTLQGHGISVTYSPNGRGPATQDHGDTFLTYLSASETRAFGKDQITVDEVDGLGTLVAATLHIVPDLGRTLFTLVVPDVALTPRGRIEIRTFAITTLDHQGLFGVFSSLDSQRETYSLVTLTGTAADAITPL